MHSSIAPAAFMSAAIVLAIAAQTLIAAGHQAAGVVMYGAALIGVLSAIAGRRNAADPTPRETQPSTSLVSAPARAVLIGSALLFGLATFVLSAGNRYTPASVATWLAGVACWALAFARRRPLSPLTLWERGLGGEGLPRTLAITTLALAAILALGAFFRFVALADNPLEMNSDHAEKLLDVKDVIDGIPYIFFERNTGREPWQFYWTVALIKLFNLPQDFMALKIGTSLIGWLMLPAIFLLARELFDTRTALIATLFAAVASWGVIPARFGLRYPLAPCAVAWTMYFLVYGLRRQSRNAMLAAGLWISIGLQGYTAYRFMVVVALLIVLVWAGWQWLHRRSQAAAQTLAHGALAAGMAGLVLMPLIRYGADHPTQLFYRAATRLVEAERPIEGSPASIFLDNLKNVLLMFHYTRDEVWVANLPDRPAMDELLAGLLIVGAGTAIALSVKRRTPWPAVLLGAGILMLIPSALSIAFPRENPSVVRTGGALPMVMIVCALGPAWLLDTLADASRRSITLRLAAYGSVAALCVAVVAVNYQRVFVDYPAQYCPRAQNASDIAREMNAWVAQSADKVRADSIRNDRRNAYLVGYPHWVDARAVGVWIGDITFSNVVGRQVGFIDPAEVDLQGKPGWFALNVNDTESLLSLTNRYPEGETRLVSGRQCGKPFVVFTTHAR
ncbi:MAG: glycosyltransferase family 39 protein [Anaerolineae bacterium]|nr:glycosyltransferase family 39 protein [Thermoflexales bacterium]MDW8408121.1 glycosyltransferase family 39 protein [Anaerolineae bacterium]